MVKSGKLRGAGRDRGAGSGRGWLGPRQADILPYGQNQSRALPRPRDRLLQDPHRDSSRPSPFLPSFPVPPRVPGSPSCPYVEGFSRGSTSCLVGPKLPARVYTYEIQLQIIAPSRPISLAPRPGTTLLATPPSSSISARAPVALRCTHHRRFPSPTFQPSEPCHGCPVYKHGRKHVISRETQTLRTLGHAGALTRGGER